VTRKYGDRLLLTDCFRSGTFSTEPALIAGLDLEMPGPSKYRGDKANFAYQARRLRQSEIDDRARRVLQFVDRASKLTIKEERRDLPEDRKLNREISGSSIVLLKNESSILPLPKNIKKIALIGSHMKSPSLTGGGSAGLQPYYVVSPFDAISEKLATTGAEILYEVGAYAHKLLPIMSHLLRTPDGKSSGGVLRFYNADSSAQNRVCIGEEHLAETNFQLMDYNKNPQLNYDLFFARVEAVFTPDVTGPWEFGLTCCGTADLYIDGELFIDNTTNQRPGTSFFSKGTAEEYAVKEFVKGREYQLLIEFGSAATSTVRNMGVTSFGGGGVRLGAYACISAEQARKQAVDAAKDADYAIICTGLNVIFHSLHLNHPN
jgi:beta-glucosidase